MNQFFLAVVVCACAGCGLARTESDEFSAPASSSQLDVPQVRKVVIVDVAELPKHVGKIVTLKGLQSRSRLPMLLDVRVDGEYALSDKLVFATGRLSSYETIAEDVKAFEKSPLSAPRPVVGTYFVITDPETGESPKTHLWNDRTK